MGETVGPSAGSLWGLFDTAEHIYWKKRQRSTFRKCKTVEKGSQRGVLGVGRRGLKAEL